MVNDDTENKLNKIDRSKHEDYKPPKEKRYRKNLSGREEKEDLHLDDILTGNPDDIPGYEEATQKNKRKPLISFTNSSEVTSDYVSTENDSDEEPEGDETQIFDQQSLPEIENPKGLGSLIENKPDKKQ